VNLVAITLDEDEQAFLLGVAGTGFFVHSPDIALSIAAKVRRAKDVSPWGELREPLPEFRACGICGIPGDLHDRLPERQRDHTWQRRRLPPVPEAMEKLPSREEAEGPRDG